MRAVTILRLTVPLVFATLALPAIRAEAATSPNPAVLLATAFHNADNAKWVHETEVLDDNGNFVEKMVNVIGSTGGRQETTFANGGRDTLIALDSKGRVYEMANAKGLVDYDVTTDTTRYANRWLMQTPASPGYAYNAEATTLQSDFLQFVLKGHLTLGPITNKDGHSVRAITGKIPKAVHGVAATETIWVTVSGAVMPYALEQAWGKFVFVETWTNWGHGIALTAPLTFVPYPSPTPTAPVQPA